jgi:hypothetical protein
VVEGLFDERACDLEVPREDKEALGSDWIRKGTAPVSGLAWESPLLLGQGWDRLSLCKL